MKLHFDSNQQYQLDAVRAVTDIFAGQELRESEKQKVKCGKAHFEKFDTVEYRQISSVGELGLNVVR